MSESAARNHKMDGHVISGQIADDLPDEDTLRTIAAWLHDARNSHRRDVRMRAKWTRRRKAA
jgi:hypothetical protein